MEVKLDKNCVLPDDMTQEELDEMLKEIQEMADSGELAENSEPLSEKEYKELVAAGYLSEDDIVIN